jgi:hypothetical protein
LGTTQPVGRSFGIGTRRSCGSIASSSTGCMR